MLRMNKLVKVITVSLVLLTNSIVSAKEVSNGSVVAQPLKKIDTESRQKLMKIMSEINQFSANFEQSVVDEDGYALQKSSGSIAVSKPNLVNWHTLVPDETQIVSDGKTLWFFDPFIEQVTAYSLDTSINNTPILLLSTNDESLWQQYNIVEINSDEFEIISLDENSQVKSLSIRFSRLTKNSPMTITQFVILDASGQRSEISLNQFKLSPEFPSDEFTFTLPDGVYLDDQR